MNYSSIHISIRHWYEKWGRKDLPWRCTKDAYPIYISEMMLQQTQVKTVLECFYHPFLRRFPNLTSIAQSPIEGVLHAWQGLGYYRRAHYIHQTAKISAPSLPTDPKELMKLPGIGKSTAHAIACFTTHAPVPILDANLRRILYRFYAIEETKEAKLWDLAYEFLDRKNPYLYNQAMMDIGATVCLPKEPRCQSCPLASSCRGKESPTLFPRPKKRKERPIRMSHYLFITEGSKILMRKRKSKMLGGLWELPHLDEAPAMAEALTQIVHDYTHFRRIATIYRPRSAQGVEGEWIERDALPQLPLSSLEKKIFERLL